MQFIDSTCLPKGNLQRGTIRSTHPDRWGGNEDSPVERPVLEENALQRTGNDWQQRLDLCTYYA